MEEEGNVLIPIAGRQGDRNEEAFERLGDIPLAVTMTSSGVLSGGSRYSHQGDDDDDQSSIYGSSYDESSVSSSVLTSSLSSFEFSQAQEYQQAPAELARRPLSQVDSVCESSHDDDIARMIGPAMQRRGVEISRTLVERASCIDSIKWLGHHLPESVVAFLIDEIEVEEAGRVSLDDFEVEGFNLSSNMANNDSPRALSPLPNGDYSARQMNDKGKWEKSIPIDDQVEKGIDQNLRNLQESEDAEEHDYSELGRDLVYQTDSRETTSTLNRAEGYALKNGYSNTFEYVKSGDYGDADTSDSCAVQPVHELYHNSYQDSMGSFRNYHGDTQNNQLPDNSIGFLSCDHPAPQGNNYNDSEQCFNDSAQKNGFGHDDDEGGMDRAPAWKSVHYNIEQAIHRPRRRHSAIGMQSSQNAEELVREVFGDPRKRRTISRRLSLPLVVRSLDTSNHSRRGSARQPAAFAHSDTDSSNSVSSLRFHKQTNDKKLSRQMRRRGSMNSVSSISSLFGASAPAVMATEQSYDDPFIQPGLDENERQEALRKYRVRKTRDSIVKLSGGLKLTDLEQELGTPSGSSDEGDEDNMYFTDAIPPATRHDCALLFVDISGFTKLSTTLAVEPLSKTINSYFQMIVDEVEAFGGDILKFAGDAVFCEWQATTSNPVEPGDGVSLAGSSQGSIEPWHGLGLEECVLTAAACGARIVDKCSDHPVYEGGGTSGTQVATLNVHCGVGFGEVVGVHVGDRETRMEYLILGDPIEQVADAILIASRGEVVASPEALVILEETAELDQCILDANMDTPQVIATKSTCFFHPIGTDHVQQDWTITLQDFTTKPRERLAKRCDDWDLSALTRLRQRMALYVHPVVVNDEFAVKVYPGDRNRAQERHRSEAELRDVYTVFIMPLITARLTGDDEEDCKVLVLLNDIMLIMTRELARFKGHLRQFIVDDKGVVLIANFGLRGSTFPNMVAERAIPFTTTVQYLLRTELKTECQVGATYGKAYCGVVGGVSRHEYAVLGPAVNLAARLMGNPNNTGFLVDQSVKEKAGSRQFRALPPVKAKGYKHAVPIFEPLQLTENLSEQLVGMAVGREQEQSEIVAVAQKLLELCGPARFVLVSGEAGSGKTALCLQATKRIEEICKSQGLPHLVIRALFSEGDVFVPFSITRPLILEILKYLHRVDHPDIPAGSVDDIVNTDEIVAFMKGGLDQQKAPESLRYLVKICEMSYVPHHVIEILGKLILTRNRADFVDGATKSAQFAMVNSIVQYIVKVFLQSTISFDLVVLALDDVSSMDEMSWKVVELLFHHSHNLIIVATTRNVSSDDIEVDDRFWEMLHSQGVRTGQFKKIALAPLKQGDADRILARNVTHKSEQIDTRQSRDVPFHPARMPHIASEILARLYIDEQQQVTERRRASLQESSRGGLDIGNIGELVLHRMDLLPSSVRTHLNLGAILGSTFDLMDVVTVFEQYRGVQKEERLKHAESVHESLEEAVRKGILEVTNRESAIHARYSVSEHPFAANNKTYKFSHDVWRSNILRLTLDEWKKDMHSLIAQSMETVVLDSQLANDYRVLTRLFSHWKESGSAKKAATLALKMGRSLEDIGLTHQSLIVYREALDMWNEMDNSNDEADEAIGGLSLSFLDQLDSSDIEHLIKLNVALGRCYTNILDPKESIRAFQTALNFIHRAPSSVLLEDRSIIFPVFSGLFVALRFGHNEDFQYEQGLVKMFLRETKLFNDPIHYSRALAMQAEMLARHGKFELALEATKELRDIYVVDDFTDLLSLAYGSDRSGQCIAQSALWNDYLGNAEEALEICDYVIEDLLPTMDPQNVHNSFHMLYPIIWVMKKQGRALEARKVFGEFVVDNFKTRLDDRGLTSDRPLHTPIMALLDMVGTQCRTDRLEEYAEWALVEKNGMFGSELNFIMASGGRSADSITAEMCLLLAHHTADHTEKTFFIRKGYEVARDAIELTKEKDESLGMILAFEQVKPIFEELEEMHSHLPPERRSRRLSCRW